MSEFGPPLPQPSIVIADIREDAETEYHKAVVRLEQNKGTEWQAQAEMYADRMKDVAYELRDIDTMLQSNPGSSIEDDEAMLNLLDHRIVDRTTALRAAEAAGNENQIAFQKKRLKSAKHVADYFRSYWQRMIDGHIK